MNIHFIGICGVAMSAIAIAFEKKGWKVTGSDAGFFPPISTYLKENNINFYPGWHEEKIGKPDLVVVGNVASSTNPEWKYVQENKLNYKSYPEVIAEYFVKENSIVCAGNYGKTSTCSLLTWIFKNAEKDPSYMFGGLSLNNIDAASIGQSNWSILEGDEYKTSRWDNSPKFKHYSPTHLLLTSAIWDHADIYPTKESYFEAFKQLVESIPKQGLIVACIDNENISELIKFAKCCVITYSKSEGSDFYYSDAQCSKEGISFVIKKDNENYKIESSVLGNYQAENITGCFILAMQAGIETDKIINSIKSYKGIKRRLEKRFEKDFTIYDDIAHSPSKAKSILETLRSIYNGKIIAIFEPNTGNRKPASFAGYDNAFDSADTVIIPRLTKVKIDPNDTEKPVDGKMLTEIIKKTHDNVLYIENDEELLDYVIKNTKKDDIVVFLGSHGFRGMIEQLITSLRQ